MNLSQLQNTIRLIREINHYCIIVIFCISFLFPLIEISDYFKSGLGFNVEVIEKFTVFNAYAIPGAMLLFLCIYILRNEIKISFLKKEFDQVSNSSIFQDYLVGYKENFSSYVRGLVILTALVWINMNIVDIYSFISNYDDLIKMEIYRKEINYGNF